MRETKGWAHVIATVDWGTGIQDAWSKVATTVPKIAAFVAILVIGMFVVRVIARAVQKLAKRAGIDKILDRAGLSKYVKRMGFTGDALLGRAVRFFLGFVVLTTALAVFGSGNPVSQLINRFVAILPRVIVAAAIIVITALVARFVSDLLRRLASGAEGINGVSVPRSIVSAASAGIWVIGGFAAVDEVGIAPTIVHTLFQALLLTAVGVTIVAVGGGGIAPMRARWDAWLGRWDESKKAANAPVPQKTTVG